MGRLRKAATAIVYTLTLGGVVVGLIVAAAIEGLLGAVIAVVAVAILVGLITLVWPRISSLAMRVREYPNLEQEILNLEGELKAAADERDRVSVQLVEASDQLQEARNKGRMETIGSLSALAWASELIPIGVKFSDKEELLLVAESQLVNQPPPLGSRFCIQTSVDTVRGYLTVLEYNPSTGHVYLGAVEESIDSNGFWAEIRASAQKNQESPPNTKIKPDPMASMLLEGS